MHPSGLVNFSEHSLQLHMRVVDATFSRQMHDILQKPAECEAFLVTAMSGIPVADSVRGYYEALGRETPLISYVAADRQQAARYRYGYDHVLSNIDTEASRLQEVLDGRDTVCVIDQYVMSGETIGYAASVVALAGVTTIYGMRGKWYHEAPRKHVDQTNLSSKFKRRMHHIGMKACHAVN